MSGLEIAGLVLGAIPVAVQVLKGYMSVLSSVKTAQSDLRSLVHELETERIRLQSTCEILLVGIVPDSVIDSLVENPFGPEWKPYSDQLRLRLWASAARFEKQVLEMREATEQLTRQLCIQADGKTSLTSRIAILQELKRNTSFTLKKKDYESVLSKLKMGNSVLHELAGQSPGLEPNRKRRSQARVVKLVRGLSQSIFNALMSVSKCCCVKSHDVCLELVPRDAVLVPSDPEEKAARDFNFHVVLGSYADSPTNEIVPSAQNARRIPRPAWWNSLSVQLAETESTLTPSAPVAAPAALSSRPKERKVRWSSISSIVGRESSSTSTTQTVIQVATDIVLVPQPPRQGIPPSVANLCQVGRRGHKHTAVECYGFITDVKRKFGLYPMQKQPDFRTTVTLREVLEGRTNLPKFDYPQKLRLALALSVSILHLYSTPWMARIITLDDIVFLEGSENGPADEAYRPFVSKNLSDASRGMVSPASAANMPRPVDLTVLSLGALLIQVIIGQTIDVLDMIGSIDMNSLLSKYTAGNQYRGRILENGGMNYDTAVGWCLQSVLETAGLGNDEFCQNFYTSVVARLQEDAKLLITS